jgi:3-oxoacid CoA-transferase subunit A
VDKYYRLDSGYAWWADEQPSDEIKAAVENNLQAVGNKVDAVLSHTCPFKYIPREMFLSMVDQSTVDNSTEEWLGELEAKIHYEKWYCGHYHTDKHIDKITFLFEGTKTFWNY